MAARRIFAERKDSPLAGEGMDKIGCTVDRDVIEVDVFVDDDFNVIDLRVAYGGSGGPHPYLNTFVLLCLSVPVRSSMSYSCCVVNGNYGIRRIWFGIAMDRPILQGFWIGTNLGFRQQHGDDMRL